MAVNIASVIGYINILSRFIQFSGLQSYAIASD